MKKKIHIALLFGGKSSEHKVSIISARSVIGALDKRKYKITPVYINKKGQWQLGFNDKLIKSKLVKQVYLSGDPITKKLISIKNDKKLPKKVDVVFPVLHGTFGEDGSIQGLLELTDIPYVGAGVVASSIGMDKALMKKVFKGSGLPIMKYLVVLRSEIEKNINSIVTKVEKQLTYPIFTKPANLGSSIGITKSHNRKELISGLKIAGEYDRKIIVEQGINKAKEIEVGVLGNDEPQASVCGEIIPSQEFYNYEDKYILDKAKLFIPAPIPLRQSEKIRKMAVIAFKAIDCAGMARVDFFIDPKNGEIFVDEINTIPGFTAISMYPKLFEASGVPYQRLLDKLISLAFERYNDKKRNITKYPTKLLK